MECKKHRNAEHRIPLGRTCPLLALLRRTVCVQSAMQLGEERNALLQKWCGGDVHRAPGCAQPAPSAPLEHISSYTANPRSCAHDRLAAEAAPSSS